MGDAGEICGGYFTPAPGLIFAMLDAWKAAHSRTRVIALTFYYLAIIAGLIALYGRGDFSTPGFVYQGF